ncbi:MAG TPA: low affinity iron permease family protein [Candidatus Saccharimonadales bacterium]|nr:low affinity iron permease family protein [Candidatus Saccharimonadales bacterium]
MKQAFQHFAYWASEKTGSVISFLMAFFIILFWFILGPLMQFSNTWQLIISTISSVVTFLMVFLIQYAQNKDTKAIHLKLDELIRINEKARNAFMNIEEKSEDELTKRQEEFDELEKEQTNNT